MTFDYHTHTTFSHGKGSIEDNVKVALEKGLSALAITDHGPGHLTYGVKRKDLPVMRAQIDNLKKKYPQIEIYMGVEANIVNVGSCLDLTEEDKSCLDFVIAGYHYGVWNGYCMANWLFDKGIFKSSGRERKLRDRNTEMTVKAIEQNEIKILTHPGDKAPFDIEELARACEKKDVWMEISTHHSHLTQAELEIVKKYDVRFVISSDAHIPSNVGEWHQGALRAAAAGVDPERIVNIEKTDGSQPNSYPVWE